MAETPMSLGEQTRTARIGGPPNRTKYTYDALNRMTTAQEAKRVVADLFEQLSRGGSVSVYVAEFGGKEYTLEVRARGQ
jgi:hypothetical protein